MRPELIKLKKIYCNSCVTSLLLHFIHIANNFMLYHVMYIVYLFIIYTPHILYNVLLFMSNVIVLAFLFHNKI